MRLLLLNGPNLNLLGTRDPETYGSTSLPELEASCRGWAEDRGHDLEAYQSNHEGALIDTIHSARGVFDGLVFNPGAYTHTSYALHDAIEAVDVPTIEIHISNIRAREAWRRESRIEPACVYQIFGRGIDGYRFAIDRLHHSALSPAAVLGDHHPDRVGDLRVPDGEGPFPVAVIIHGGFWRDVWTRDTLDALAVDLHARGYATWNVEYRRIPPIGAWRTTIDDVVDAVDAVAPLAEQFPLDVGDVTLVGHSAGAHLAVMAASRTQRPPKRMLLLGGVLDLELLDPDHDALPKFLGDELDSHRPTVDPKRHIPDATSAVAVHGTHDDSVHPDHSRNYAAAAGSTTELIELEGSDHWDIIDPSSAAWSKIVERL